MNVKIFTGVLNFVLPARITRASKNIFTPNKTGRKENREDEKNPSNKEFAATEKDGLGKV